MQQKRLHVYFLIGWIVINVISAFKTELYADEAYYWMWSKQLDWGYFDHPPLIAALIASTNWLGQNELAVRLGSILCVAASLHFTHELIPSSPGKTSRFWIFSLGLFALHTLGFMALPDAPLLLFTVLFLKAYREFVLLPNIKNTFILALMGALLIYSKYHGFVICGLVVLSNLKLLKSKMFWLAVACIVILISPHIYWLVSNQFPTFRYHLSDRASPTYSLSYTTGYIIQLLFFFGPALGLFLVVSVREKLSTELFQRALQFVTLGIIALFFIMSFRGRTEANWTLPIIIPGLYWMTKKNWSTVLSRILVAMSVFAFVVGIAFRTLVNIDLGASTPLKISQFQGSQKVASDLKLVSHGIPIVANTYQHASLLSFYTDHNVLALNIDSRHNQYDLWDWSHDFHGDTVLYVSNDGLNNKIQNWQTTRGIDVRVIKGLPVLKNIILEINKPELTGKPGQSLERMAKYKWIGTYDMPSFSATKKHGSSLGYIISKDDQVISWCDHLTPIDYDKLNSLQSQSFTIHLPRAEGSYKIKYLLRSKNLGKWYVSSQYDLEVK